MRIVLSYLILMSAIVLGDFLDDFESYAPGQDPDISPDWSREPTGGYVLVTEDGGNQAVEAHFPDSAFIGYLCEGAGIWDDGSVAMDFNITGGSTLVSVLGRMQLFTGEAYVGGLAVWVQPFTYAYIAHVSATGEYDILYQEGGPSMPPDTWMNARLEMEGENPVTLSLYFDDALAGQAEDTAYVLGSGLSGFAMLYEEGVPEILADDFQVVLTPQTMRAMTFGSLKAVFAP